ncbi:MAG: histidinol-phosphate transaminase [Chloroflexi bacterium]|nr:histidinol-phosphate transaminase [Chloroflexota bacterium]
MSVEPRATLDHLVRPAVARISPYVPAETMAELCAASGLTPAEIIKLDANENVYGSSPAVARALAAQGSYHIYPDPEQTETRAAVARYLGVPAANVLLGNGSDELIHLLTLVYLDSGDEVIDFTPSFAMYPIYSGLMGARMVCLPRDDAFALDPEAGLRAVSDRTKIIFVANPNNPTGTFTPREAILRLLESGRIVVVDEAYAEFAPDSLVRDVLRYDNLVVLRSFSKWAALAGVRAGAIVAQEHVLAHFWKIKSPFNLTVPAMLAVQAALDDLAYLQNTVERVKRERERLASLLHQIDYLRVYPSAGNFLYVEVTRGSAARLRARLVQRGISVRHFAAPERIVQGLRITVGTPEHTDRLVAALRDLSPE